MMTTAEAKKMREIAEKNGCVFPEEPREKRHYTKPKDDHIMPAFKLGKNHPAQKGINWPIVIDALRTFQSDVPTTAKVFGIEPSSISYHLIKYEPELWEEIKARGGMSARRKITPQNLQIALKINHKRAVEILQIHYNQQKQQEK